MKFWDKFHSLCDDGKFTLDCALCNFITVLATTREIYPKYKTYSGEMKCIQYFTASDQQLAITFFSQFAVKYTVLIVKVKKVEYSPNWSE